MERAAECEDATLRGKVSGTTSESAPQAFLSPAATAELSRLAGAPGRSLPDVRILRDGSAAFPAMIALIEGARRRVRFENFIFAGDATGRRFAAALSAAARRGVDVRVLYDPIGTLMVRGGSIAGVLRRDGVLARPFRPLSPVAPWSWLRLRHRDHRKTLAVDGSSAVVGGLCISDDWAATAAGGGNWRDTALLVQGPLAGDVEAAFETMWELAGAASTRAAVDPAPPTVPPLGVVVADRPDLGRVANVYEWLANRARHTLEITDAYLVAPRRVLASFEAAARRGVAVRLLLPGRNNHPLAGAAARRIYQPLLDAGARIYEWAGAMVHAKTAVVDGEVTLVGSSNLDPLSMHRNYELNLLVVDTVTGTGMREMFERDLTGARAVDPGEWQHRPLWQRVAERAAGVFDSSL